MSASAWSLLALYLVVLVLLAWPLGRYLAALCDGAPAALDAARRKRRSQAGRRLARRSDALAQLRAGACSRSTRSACWLVYALQRLQGVLPLNPQASARCRPTRRSTPR